MATKLNVKERAGKTRSQLNRLRAEGEIPAIVYGKEIETKAITISEKEFTLLTKGDPNVIIQVDVPNEGKQSVMIQSVQRDPIKRNILHVDLLQINLKDKITATVRISFEGSPAGVREGGVQQIELHEIEVECLPTDIPSQISIDISELNIGDTLTAGQLTMPEDVELITDPEQALINVLQPQAEEEVEDEDASDDDTPAEPELVGSEDDESDE